MNNFHYEGIPWRRFMEFISAKADRFLVLKKVLEEAKLNYQVLDISGNRHFYVTPPPPLGRMAQMAGDRPPSVLVAHYDRAEGSPGANDNSAGVFLLLEAAIKLKRRNVKNWILIFTDKEELKTGESIQAQGAYGLAMDLKTMKLKNAKIFSFDVCGSGDTLIISTTLEYLLKKEENGEKQRKSMRELRKLALETARDLRMEKVLLAPTPFSDDVGFFRAGLCAQTITMLPSPECIQLMAELRKNPEFPDALISAELRKTSGVKFIPETWQNLNSPSDSYLRLTPEHFRTVVRFAEALCSQ